MKPPFPYDATVIGSGPNGLAAAITLAREGFSVAVFERNGIVGGGASSAELTLPGFIHDICSAIHPFAVSSPFFDELPLEQFGLKWVHPELPLAHPQTDGSASVLQQSLQDTCDGLGEDGKRYQRLMGPLVRDWKKLRVELLGPILHFPRHPFKLARFGIRAMQPASVLARGWFRTRGARALFAGMAAHSFLPLNSPVSAAFGMMLAGSGHFGGWPFPEGGTQKLADAMAAYLRSLGGEIHLNSEIRSLWDLPGSRVVLCDVGPDQFVRLAGERLPWLYRRRISGYKYGPAAFKVDYALSAPVPWKAVECRRAGTVHIGGTLDEIEQAEHESNSGVNPEKPFVLVAQHSLFDATRAPAGSHTAWVYCHLPFASTCDMTARIEQQIERFAPGFRDCILKRAARSPLDLERHNPNLVGGDVNGGSAMLPQLLARPVLSANPYKTAMPGVYLCSASTPPGGGVHGMCGHNAAKLALQELRKQS